MSIRSTQPLFRLLVARLIAGVPLTFFGTMKFLNEGTQINFEATLGLAGFPRPDLLMFVAAAVEVVGGILLLTGWHARIGAALAVAEMLVALYVHLTVDFSLAPAGGPPHWLPVIVLLSAILVLWKGAGRGSLDHYMTRSAP